MNSKKQRWFNIEKRVPRHNSKVQTLCQCGKENPAIYVFEVEQRTKNWNLWQFFLFFQTCCDTPKVKKWRKL